MDVGVSLKAPVTHSLPIEVAVRLEEPGMRTSLIVVLFGLAACSPAEPRRSTGWTETFEGDVVAVNGAAVAPSFRMTFYSTDGVGAADRYRITSQCFDAGYFDQDRRVFLSSSSPRGQGADQMSEELRRDMADRPRRRCPSDHPATYNRLLDVTYAGAALTIHGDRARLTSQESQSIDLVRVPQVMLFD